MKTSYLANLTLLQDGMIERKGHYTRQRDIDKFWPRGSAAHRMMRLEYWNIIREIKNVKSR